VRERFPKPGHAGPKSDEPLNRLRAVQSLTTRLEKGSRGAAIIAAPLGSGSDRRERPAQWTGVQPAGSGSGSGSGVGAGTSIFSRVKTVP
jgi:hypothetical protein